MRTAVKRWLGIACIALALLGCGPKKPEAQSFVGGQPVNLDQLTAAEVARAVRVTPREDDIFFQAPTIQTTKLIDLRSVGQEYGVSLGDVQRVRIGYLSGSVQRRTGAATHYLLFQTNFVTGSDRYQAVNLANGQPLEFTVARAEDPCVPNCFPVVEALIVSIPDQVLRANTTTGLPLTITLSTGDSITMQGLPAYVQGYLQVVDAYRQQILGGGSGPPAGQS
jgi:hypothetical protein